MNIAVVGFGVVGKGVCHILLREARRLEQETGQPVVLKRILDIQDITEAPYAALASKNAEDVFTDSDIDLVCETIGGCGAALSFTRQALSQGKHVVTSNKELVATHGVELLQLAYEKGVHYYYEAAVGGGIPLIKPIRECLAANKIDRLDGIINGTTNYILSEMEKAGLDFETALQQAQALGFAEKNPTADVEGIDACRKIAILTNLITGDYLNPDQILTEGISTLTQADANLAEALGCVIKLVASLREQADGRLAVSVAPRLIPRSHLLASVHGVYNLVLLHGEYVNDVAFYGPGAGSLPTASAIVGDILACCMTPFSQATAERWETGASPDRYADLEQQQVKAALNPRDQAAAELLRSEPAVKTLKAGIATGTDGQSYVVAGQTGFLSEADLAAFLGARLAKNQVGVLRLLD
ncbi:MAG: homoserine dehydrogenase [Oscillospiraceae bacterium]|nr:homoserine dehydrogenase [Oscillospiraceae bacterium]MDD4367453.1 homoserine dehydrogenase [Oscillospiraceae bacterium]